jgi:hypothetical protein
MIWTGWRVHRFAYCWASGFAGCMQSVVYNWPDAVLPGMAQLDVPANVLCSHLSHYLLLVIVERLMVERFMNSHQLIL